jgi:cell division protein FtsB
MLRCYGVPYPRQERTIIEQIQDMQTELKQLRKKNEFLEQEREKLKEDNKKLKEAISLIKGV